MFSTFLSLRSARLPSVTVAGIVVRTVKIALDDPMHMQPPRVGVDLRHRAVPQDVERVRAIKRTLGQGGGPGLGVERLLLVHDEVRALSVATHPTNRNSG